MTTSIRLVLTATSYSVFGEKLGLHQSFYGEQDDDRAPYCGSSIDSVPPVKEMTLASSKITRNPMVESRFQSPTVSSVSALIQEQDGGSASTHTVKIRPHSLMRPESPMVTQDSEGLKLSAPKASSARKDLPIEDAGSHQSLNGGAYLSMASRLPSPSPAMLIRGTLLQKIKDYFDCCCRSMMFDENEILRSPDGTEFRNDRCNDFDSYCFTATTLVQKGLKIDFLRALSKACALVKPILQTAHPRTLSCFFEVLVHLIQVGHPDVAFHILDFINQMFESIGEEESPLGHICRLLGQVDHESFLEAMVEGWECVTNTFDRILGFSHRLAVSVRLDYVKRIMVNDLSKEEALLRDLLSRLGITPGHSTPRVMLNLAHNLNKQCRHEEAQDTALEVLRLLDDYGMYAERKTERIESLKALSLAQTNMPGAERNWQAAIQMIVQELGHLHPWTLEFKSVLEGWLRDWGREEEANTLRREIGEIAKHDDFDE